MWDRLSTIEPRSATIKLNPQVPSRKGVGTLGITRGLTLSAPSHFWSTDSRDSGVSWYFSKHFNKCICSIKHIYIQQQWKNRVNKYNRKT